MIFSDKFKPLLGAIAERMSEKRYSHTLGVAAAADKIATYCLPDSRDGIIAAALLHDVAKELDTAQALDIIRNHTDFTDSDLLCEAAHHSLAAPYVIISDFPEYASKDILSAVRNHTVGSPDMTLFDEIIFVADYVEEGRAYGDCIRAREALFSAMASARDREECILHLHRITREILDYTITYVIKKQRFLHGRTVETRNAFLSREPKAL
jgi:predicted HD superfamily hydrolase involved in NAD metabolism